MGVFLLATTNTKTTVKTAEAEVKKTATKTTPVKTESKPAAKAVETKTKAAKKTTVAKTTRKPAAKKGTEVKADVFVQFGGKEFSEEAIMSKVVAAWEAEGKSICDQESKTLYQAGRWQGILCNQ